jgi:hypothetical protein
MAIFVQKVDLQKRNSILRLKNEKIYSNYIFFLK